MTSQQPRACDTYEEVANYLLERLSDALGLGLERVEGKQKLVGKSGMEWTVDGKGVKTDDGAVVIIEARRYTNSKLKAEAVGAIQYRINDVGAAGAIVVTPIGLQEGGEKIAQYHHNLQTVHLDADSTTTDYVLKFLGHVFLGASAGLVVTPIVEATAEVTHPDGSKS